MKRCSILSRILFCFIVFFAALVQGFGMYQIHTAAKITEGGILGATLLLYHWFGISPAISSFFLNLVCYLLGFRTLGKSFLFFSFAAAMGYSAGYHISEQVGFLWPVIADYPLAAAVLGSFLVGICTGICVRIGGAASGDDALAMSLSRILRVPIQKIYLASDLLVLTLSLTYIAPKRIVYSLLTVVLSGQIIGFLQEKR